MSSRFASRLQNEMDSLKNKNTSEKVKKELGDMEVWAQKKLEWGNRQGNVDVRYLADRYSKGVQKVQDFCARSHRLISIGPDNFSDSQAEMMRFAAAASDDGPENLG